MKKIIAFVACAALISSSVSAQFQLPRSFQVQKERIQQSNVLQSVMNWSQQKKDAVKRLGTCLIHPRKCSRSEVKKAYAYFVGIPVGIIMTILAVVGIYVGPRELQTILGRHKNPSLSQFTTSSPAEPEKRLQKLSPSEKIKLQNAEIELQQDIYEKPFVRAMPFSLSYESIRSARQLDLPRDRISREPARVNELLDAFYKVNQTLGITDPTDEAQTTIINHLSPPAMAVWKSTLSIYEARQRGQ